MQAITNDCIGHRVHIGAKLAQLIAKTLGQYLGAIRQNLPHLDKHGAQLFKQTAQADRRNVVPHLIFTEKLEYLADSPAPAGGRQLVLLARSDDGRLVGNLVHRTLTTMKD